MVDISFVIGAQEVGRSGGGWR